MKNLRAQGDNAAGPHAQPARRPWATPRVIVSLDAANAEKGAIPTQETGGSAPNNANYSVS